MGHTVALLLLVVIGVGESHPVFEINWIEDSRESTTTEQSVQDKFFRYPTHTFTTFEDKEIVKVLKKEEILPTTEASETNRTEEASTPATLDSTLLLTTPQVLEADDAPLDTKTEIALQLLDPDSVPQLPDTDMLSQPSETDNSSQLSEIPNSPISNVENATSLDLDTENTTLPFAVTAEPFPPLMIAGEISKREVKEEKTNWSPYAFASQLNLGRFKKEKTSFKKREVMGSGNEYYLMDYE